MHAASLSALCGQAFRPAARLLHMTAPAAPRLPGLPLRLLAVPLLTLVGTCPEHHCLAHLEVARLTIRLTNA